MATTWGIHAGRSGDAETLLVLQQAELLAGGQT